MARGSNRALRVGATAAVILVLGIGACAETPPAGPVDVGETYPIEAVATRFELAVRFEPGHSHLSYADSRRLVRFLRMYHSRARTELVIATTPDAEGLKAQEHMAAFRERLVAEGVIRKRISLRPGTAPLGNNASVVLSFGGYDIRVPECGDWSGTAGFNPSNLPHTNFGCAYQRNVGLMLADPGDYVASEGESYIDARRSDLQLEVYRGGGLTGAELPVSEAPGFASD